MAHGILTFILSGPNAEDECRDLKFEVLETAGGGRIEFNDAVLEDPTGDWHGIPKGCIRRVSWREALRADHAFEEGMYGEGKDHVMITTDPSLRAAANTLRDLQNLVGRARKKELPRLSGSTSTVTTFPRTGTR